MDFIYHFKQVSTTHVTACFPSVTNVFVRTLDVSLSVECGDAGFALNRLNLTM